MARHENLSIGTLTLDNPPQMSIQASSVGTKNGSTVSVAEYGDGIIHKTVLTCTATPITISDDGTTSSYGGVKLYDFPAGLIMTLGAVIDGSVTAAAPIINTWAGGIALGTATASTGADLVSTEADIMPEVDVAAATAKVAVVDAVTVAVTDGTASGARWLDGTATAKDLYLNLVIDNDAAHTGAMSATFTGTVTIHWINLGDK